MPTHYPPRRATARRIAAKPWQPEAWGDALRRILRLEAAGALLLSAALAVAVVWANSAPASYASFWLHPLHWFPAGTGIEENLQGLLNSGLMTVFFLAVGLEIGRERVVGSLRDTRNAVLP